MLGYCLFPLTIAALINVFVHTIIIRLPVIAVTYIWSAFGRSPCPPPSPLSALLLSHCPLICLLFFEISLTDFSFSECVGFAWESVRRTEVAGYLSSSIILLCSGIYHPYIELRSREGADLREIDGSIVI